MTWAAKSNDLEQLAREAERQGVRLGEVSAGSRRHPDGVRLAWRYTNPRTVLADGLIPFFIDWGQTPHPAQAAATGATLVDLRAEHPEPERARSLLEALGIALPVTAGPRPALIATIDSPRARVELW